MFDSDQIVIDAAITASSRSSIGDTKARCLAVQRENQRRGDGVGIDPQQLAGLQPKRMVENELGEPVVARIAHVAAPAFRLADSGISIYGF